MSDPNPAVDPARPLDPDHQRVQEAPPIAPAAAQPEPSVVQTTPTAADQAPSLFQPAVAAPNATSSFSPGHAQPHTDSPAPNDTVSDVVFGATPAPAAPVPSQPAPSRRGPGWPGVVAVGVGAAALASFITAGLVSPTSQDTTTPVRSTVTSGSAGSSGASRPAAPAASNVTSPDWAQVAKTVEPSVVAVKIAANGQEVGEGSGVILDADGHVLTNAHVVSEGASAEISVVLADGRIFPVTILGTDPSADLAVLKFQSVPADLAPATLADSSTVAVGQPVMAVGNPLGLASTATTGIVSALDRPVTTGSGQGAGQQAVTNAIQTDAAINPGNSGGALVDAQGQVIGITSSIATLNDDDSSQAGSIGLGFAIPSSSADTIAQQIISSGKAKHGYLGLDAGDTQVEVDGAERQAALVGTVSSDAPAAQAGLKQGDAVIAVNGKTVESADALVARIRELQPGDTVTLAVVREDGSKQDIQVTLAERPTN